MFPGEGVGEGVLSKIETTPNWQVVRLRNYLYFKQWRGTYPTSYQRLRWEHRQLFAAPVL
jgi:hypothetical protein